MSADVSKTDSGNKTTAPSDELERILALIDERCKDGKTRIKRETLTDGSENTVIRYTECDGNGNAVKETYCTEKQLEEIIKNTKPSSAHNNGKSRSVKKSAQEKLSEGEPSVSEHSDEDTTEITHKNFREKAGDFFKSLLKVTVPVALILTLMLVGQNYIKLHSSDKIRLMTIETVPLYEENSTKKITVNINTANAAELTYLPGIGEAKAKNIIEYREKNGNFDSVEKIMNVNGIGEDTFLNIKEYITVDE